MTPPVSAQENTFQHVFEECNVEGVVAISDLSGEKVMVTDKGRYVEGTLPASTFKIVNTLIGLDMGVVKKGELFLWDGVKRDYEPWNNNLSLEEAFKYSAVWVHETINARLNKDAYKRYLGWLGYGDGNIKSGKENNFWVYGDFKVTPEQQMHLLKRLYSDALPFSKDSMQHVKQLMRVYDAQLGQVHSKTGWTRKEGKHIGWWVGYIVSNKKPLFFVTRIIRNEKEGHEGFLECRKSITRKMIEQFSGKGAGK